MNKKMRILILASTVSLIALSVIQGYLIKNTYQIKKDAFLNKTRKEIGRLDNYSPAIDSINTVWQEYFIDELKQYHSNYFYHLNNETNIKNSVTSNQKIKKLLIKNLLKKANALSATYTKLYHDEMKEKGFLFDIKIQRRINEIILTDGLQIDTIFSDRYNEKMYLIGDKFDYIKGHKVSNAIWMTDHDYETTINKKALNLNFDLQFSSTDYMNIDGWKNIVLKKMIGVLSLALIIFLFVFGLLFYSIKNLIKQKKIADVKTDFVNNITHELKTPLATLTLATKILLNTSVKKNEAIVNKTILTVERQNKRLQKLIDQVLDNSLGYQEIQIKKENIEIEAYLNTIIDDFLLSIQNENIKINTSFSIKNKTVKIDKFYFTTAILNILENAVKYNNAKVNINITVNTQNAFILSIKDNGIGISKKNQANIFDKFYRVNNKNQHNVKGLGLGLYYTNQIVKAHQGTIKIISKELKGTEFIIKLPI